MRTANREERRFYELEIAANDWSLLEFMIHDLFCESEMEAA
jgi:hypothetical protein